MPLEVLEADPVATPTDQRVERAKRFGGDVLEDEDARHAATMPNAAASSPIAMRHALIAAGAA